MAKNLITKNNADIVKKSLFIAIYIIIRLYSWEYCSHVLISLFQLYYLGIELYVSINWVKKNRITLYMSKITDQERLDLKKLLKESDSQDNTEYIRRVKHSVKIRDDIRVLDRLKKTESKLYAEDPERFTEVAKRQASFLHENYPDLFKKMIAEELDLAIMSRLLAVLKLIEDGKTDQPHHQVQV